MTPTCNFGKQSLTEQQFYDWINSIVEHRASVKELDYQRVTVEVEL
jgi:hypothetical protein